jgi:hypothetical protein
MQHFWRLDDRRVHVLIGCPGTVWRMDSSRAGHLVDILTPPEGGDSSYYADWSSR